MAYRTKTAGSSNGTQNPTSGQSDAGGLQNGDSEELNERHFLIPIRDGHGHSERLSLRVHPNYMPVLNQLLHSKKFPFRSVNDIIRFGIDRVCRDLERRGEIPSKMRHLDALREMLDYEDQNLEYLTNFETMNRVAQSLINTNAPHEAARIVAGFRHHVQAMPEGYWRTRYEQELLTRFGHLLRVTAGDGANLSNGDSEE